MIQNCIDGQGKARCFYKGYASSLDATFTLQSRDYLSNAFSPCLSNDGSCADQLFHVMLTGPGVPTYQSWFWSSRKVYVEVEPAYWFLISSGAIGPAFSIIRTRLSPGFCDATTGAIESQDWRDYETVGQDSATATSLRSQRSSAVFQVSFVACACIISLPFSPLMLLTQALVEAIPGTLPPNSGWFLKQVWRKSYTNESLFFSPLTADGKDDTSPGYFDAALSATVGAGAFWRHQLACVPSTNCQSYFIYNDTCKVQRVAQSSTPSGPAGPFNASQWSLSPCVFPNGTVAYLDPSLGEAGRKFNESSYLSQFPTQVTDYSWYGSVDAMDAEAHIRRNFYTYPLGYGSDNVTSYFYTKDLVSYGTEGTVDFIPSNSPANTDLALDITLFLSVAIALLCGILVTCFGIFFGLHYLSNVTKTMEIVAKAKAQHLAECTAKLYAMISAEKEQLIAKERLSREEAREARVDDPTIEDELAGFMSGAPTMAADKKKEGKGLGKKPRVLLLKEEKLEILYTMDINGYTAGNVMQWNIDDMVKVWREELDARKVKDKARARHEDASECFTLSVENRLPDLKGMLVSAPVDPIVEQKLLAEKLKTAKERERRLAIVSVPGMISFTRCFSLFVFGL